LERAPWIPPRDWGRSERPTLWISAGPDVGVFLGAGYVSESYGFRKDPYASRHRLRGGWALSAQQPRVDYVASFHRLNSRLSLGLQARASGIEILRFYNLGNETRADQESSFYKVQQRQLALRPSVTWSGGRTFTATLGPVLEYARTATDQERLITHLRPYGFSSFGQVGGRLELQLDTRDRPVAAGRGALLSLQGELFPRLWDVERPFGRLRGEASGYLTLGGRRAPVLALRAAGERVWGRFPFHASAFVGGADTVRSLPPQRLAGEASLFANAELRLPVADFFLVLPGEWGLLALADAGRVYVSGEQSRRWHTAWGGGLWLAYLNRNNTVTLAVARGEQQTRVYLQAGFAF